MCFVGIFGHQLSFFISYLVRGFPSLVVLGASEISVAAILDHGLELAGVEHILSLRATADPLAADENLWNLERKKRNLSMFFHFTNNLMQQFKF